MKPKTAEFLYFLLWSCEVLSRPTFRNLTEGFESWAYRTGLLRQLQRLERDQFIEKMAPSASFAASAQFYRLTERGRLLALGGRDPQQRWSRKWDGKWRFILFDVPLSRNSERRQLRRFLHDRFFGYVQGSVWVSPDPLSEEHDVLASISSNTHGLLTLEARPCEGTTDKTLVTEAWDFERINSRYEQHFAVLNRRPRAKLTEAGAPEALRKWAADERSAWAEAVSIDPLLPEALLPSGYLGRRSWAGRVEALEKSGAQVRSWIGK